MKIPGWAYIGLGVMISAYAKFIENKSGNAAMKLFFYIGVAMIVIGAFKLLISYIANPKEKESEGAGEDFSRTPKENFPEPAKRSNGKYVTCNRCTARLHIQSRYCNWCGYKVKR